MLPKAQRMARAVVRAYVNQDLRQYEKACNNFKEVFGGLFTDVPKASVAAAARDYTAALRLQDSVTELRMPVAQKQSSPVWDEVVEKLKEFSVSLGLASAFAVHTREFWKLHSAQYANGYYKWTPEGKWTVDCMWADLYFVNGVVGPERGEKVAPLTGPLYLAAVGCHDMRDENGHVPREAIENGVNIMAQYYSIER